MMDIDPAGSLQAATSDHPMDHILEALCPCCRRAVDAVCPDCGTHVESSGAGESHMPANGQLVSYLTSEEFYRRLVLLFYNSRNSKFMLGCYLIATGCGFADGMSMTEYAAKWGVGKATVSKQCRFICTHLGIQPSSYMRDERRAARFRLTNRRPQKNKLKWTQPTH